MKAKIENDICVAWPYTFEDLKRDNPQTSFPTNPSEELLLSWGLVDVDVESQPQTTYEQNARRCTPVFQNNVWTQTWVVTNASGDEINQRTADLSTRLRAERDSLLVNCDWTQVIDAPVDQTAWAIYRQSLRDITIQPGFPWNVNWPETP